MAAWNGGFVSTKYVNTIAIGTGTGVITITYGANIPQVNGNTILLSPFVSGAALAAGAPGNVDWACTSASKATATSQGYGAAGLGSVAAKYVPTQCK